MVKDFICLVRYLLHFEHEMIGEKLISDKEQHPHLFAKKKSTVW